MVFNIDWVLRDELAVGAIPKTYKDILELKKNQIQSILSLCAKDEYPVKINCEEYFSCKRVVLPDHKYKNPPNIEQLNLALDTLESIINSGPVYVHCVAGVERSPLVCMACLVKKHDLTPTQALDYLMDIHSGTNSLPKQLRLLHHLKKDK